MQRQANDMALAIESLLLDDNGIEKIAVHLGGFNIFETIGHTRSEERHSVGSLVLGAAVFYRKR